MAHLTSHCATLNWQSYNNMRENPQERISAPLCPAVIRITSSSGREVLRITSPPMLQSPQDSSHPCMCPQPSSKAFSWHCAEEILQISLPVASELTSKSFTFSQIIHYTSTVRSRFALSSLVPANLSSPPTYPPSVFFTLLEIFIYAPWQRIPKLFLTKTKVLIKKTWNPPFGVKEIPSPTILPPSFHSSSQCSHCATRSV